jgi:periplasmic protein TonB
MAGRDYFIGASVAAHLALGVGLGRLEVRESHAATAIEIADVPKPKKAPEPAKVDPVPAKAEPAKPRAHHVAAPKPAENTPPPAPAPASRALEAAPDFGLSLSGGVGGDGLAIPAGGGGARQPLAAAHPAPVRRALAMPSSTASECEEPTVKPKPKNVPQPAYTTTARAAGVEGKVRVRLTVDETGKVVEVTVLQGLGYGLDEAALEAARDATFEPATQCGKPVRATFTISMRFSAG